MRIYYFFSCFHSLYANEKKKRNYTDMGFAAEKHQRCWFNAGNTVQKCEVIWCVKYVLTNEFKYGCAKKRATKKIASFYWRKKQLQKYANLLKSITYRFQGTGALCIFLFGILVYSYQITIEILKLKKKHENCIFFWPCFRGYLI